jgi:glycosyltransferase involved in cell wall biosynthesis
MPNSKTLTIGIPCYNESITIAKVVRDFQAAYPAARILVIDNASSDDTALIAKKQGAEVISEHRKGKGYAVQRLFQECTSEYLIMVDGDDTYPAEEAAKLLKKIEEEGGDTIVGTRVSSEAAAFKTTHTWANQLLAWTVGSIFRSPVGDLFSGYRLFTKAFYRNVPVLSTGFEVETELAIQTIDKGFVQKDVGINFRSRPEGSFSKLNTVQDGLRVLRVIITVVKDFKPMMFFSWVGSFFVFLSLVVGSFPIADFIRYRYIFHVPLAILAMGLGLLASLSFMCGLILDTIVRYEREQFLLRIRNYKDRAY